MKRKRKKRVTWSLYHLRLRAYNAQGGLCHWCKQPMKRDCGPTDPRLLTADHLVPLYAGGKTQPDNIVAACRHCNNTRHAEINMPKRADATFSSGDDSARSPFEKLLQLMK